MIRAQQRFIFAEICHYVDDGDRAAPYPNTLFIRCLLLLGKVCEYCCMQQLSELSGSTSIDYV